MKKNHNFMKRATAWLLTFGMASNPLATSATILASTEERPFDDQVVIHDSHISTNSHSVDLMQQMEERGMVRSTVLSEEEQFPLEEDETELAPVEKLGQSKFEQVREEFFQGLVNRVKPELYQSFVLAEGPMVQAAEKPEISPAILPELEYIIADPGETPNVFSSNGNNNYGYGAGQISVRPFQVNATNNAVNVNALLVAQGEHCNIWWVDPVATSFGGNAPSFTRDVGQNTNAVAAELAARIDTIYTKMTTEIAAHAGVIVEVGFSNMPQLGDVDEDGRVNLILYDIGKDGGGSGSYTGGYYSGTSYYNTTSGQEPIDVVHMDIGYGQGMNSSYLVGFFLWMILPMDFMAPLPMNFNIFCMGCILEPMNPITPRWIITTTPPVGAMKICGLMSPSVGLWIFFIQIIT